MSDLSAFLITLAVLVVALAVAHRPFGDYMARVYESKRHLAVERGIYRLMGVDPDADQRWTVYVRSVLAFSVVSVLLLFAFQRVQQWLPMSLGFPAVPPDQAFNTAASFVTNTNWQSYSGEATMGYLVQMAGLAVQNFVSAAVGMVVAITLVRAFARTRTDRLGNFWTDLVRTCVRILLPLAFIGALVLLAGGVVQNLTDPTDVTTLAGGAQTIPGGAVASQEAIKELGTNGGGFFNANSAHPFENPTAWTNLFEIFLILLIPVSLTRTFGRMVGSLRHGYAILAVMTVLFVAAMGLTVWAELSHGGAALQAAGAAMEGKETRFGVPSSALFGTATTMTSTGAVNSFFSSFTPFGGGLVLFDMLLGEVSPGGVGSGLYGMLVLAILTVFIAGLMVGRTPEYLGKKIGPREMKLVSLYILSVPAVVLIGTGIAMALPGPRESILNGGPHGLTEVLYAFTSAGNNNGSAFAGLNANTPFYNTGLGIAVILGRFIPIVLVLALAGSLAQQRQVPETEGTLPAYRPLFVGLVVGVALIVTGLTYFPALALGPLAEGLF
jgi:potassium-transporting ATPase potassium-binding subunit